MTIGNYKQADYAKPGVMSYFLADKQLFVIGGTAYPVEVSGNACGIGPVYVLAGFKIYIGVPTCGSTAASQCYHFEGPVRVPDYNSNAVVADGGMLFDVKPAWKGHFLSTLGFVPLPPIPVV